MHIRIEAPHKFEVNSHDSCSVPETSKASKSIYIRIKDSLSYYMDSSHKDDILNLGSSADYDYKGYQINWYNIILRSLWSVFKTFTTHQETLNQVETERFEILKPKLENLHSGVINVKNSLSAANFQVAEVWRLEIAIVDLCSLILLTYIYIYIYIYIYLYSYIYTFTCFTCFRNRTAVMTVDLKFMQCFNTNVHELACLCSSGTTLKEFGLCKNIN